MRARAVALLIGLAGGSNAIASSKNDIVQRQIDAYNAQSANAFADCYAPDARVYHVGKGDAPVLSGREAIRTSYATLFANNPGRRVIIAGRLAEGMFVTPDERVATAGPRALVTYELRDGLIARAWILAAPPVSGAPS